MNSRSPRRVVLTGGPGAGKTVISRELAASRAGRIALVPEAATQVYHALQTRWDRLDLAGRKDVQRRIYRLQIQQEQIALDSNPGSTLLLDRGTIDGSVYWPDGPEAYWVDLGTTLADELSRYDAVIWLQTSAALGLYDGDTTNSCRFEDPQAAIDSGHRLRDMWGSHPKILMVPAFVDFQEKLNAVRLALDSVLS